MSINYHELSAEYDTTGVAVVADSVVDFKKVDRAREAIPDIRAGIYDTGVAPEKVWDEGTKKLAKMDNTHLSNKSIAELTASKEVGRVVAKVTGSNRVQVWATQLLEKPPTSGGKANVGWHQDRQYWTFWDTAEGLFTAWIALDVVGESSGPVRFVAGSHRWGFLESGDFFDPDIDKIREGIKLPPGEVWNEIPAILPKAGLSIHHSLTYHGSGPNSSERPRVSLVLHMRNEIPKPVAGRTDYYVSHLDDETYCPVIYEA